MLTSLRTYLDFALAAAWEAGQITLQYFHSGIQAEWKADASPVTLADRQAEEHIRRRIEKQFPGHAILGEEYGPAGGNSFCWHIDPIDGTRSFIRGVPLYGVLLGLEVDGKSQVGVAYFPALNETLYAAAGEGCWCNGRATRVSTATRLADALLVHADAAAFERWGKRPAFERLCRAVQYRAGWCDAYGYLLVATGRAELMLDPKMSSWDCGPFPVIFNEAGGYFGDWHGNITLYGEEALGTTQALLPEVLRLVEGST